MTIPPTPRTAPRQVALLIDAENLSYLHTPQILRHAASLGKLALKKAYGDFGRDHLQSWVESLREHAIRPHSGYPYTKEKNSADQALIDDVRCLLGTRRFQAFVIASTDSDFSDIAREIAAAGAAPYGIGNAGAKVAYKRVWQRYFEVSHIPTIRQFKEAVFEYQRRDPTSHNVRTPIHNLEMMMFHLNRVSTNPRDYGCSDFAALLSCAGFDVDLSGPQATVRRTAKIVRVRKAPESSLTRHRERRCLLVKQYYNRHAQTRLDADRPRQIEDRFLLTSLWVRELIRKLA